MGLVITACTSRKRARAAPQLCAASLPRAQFASLVDEWLRRLDAAEERMPAQLLYAGRGFQEAVAACAALQFDLGIVSAGLGLVKSTTLVPPYATSVVEGSSDSILTRVEGSCSASAWWRALTDQSPFSTTISAMASQSTGPILIALSDAYLSMIGGDLDELDGAILNRVRILTRTPSERVAPSLRRFLMPYDDRLDGPDSPIRGTRGDFAQRAARHFAERVVKQSPQGSAAEHASAVGDAMGEWALPARTERKRQNDEALIEILCAHWETAGGHSSKLLRVLRDDLNIACEQGRFVSLMRQVRERRVLAA